jgi:glycosyltransferase involved in cell wall biosynthesis
VHERPLGIVHITAPAPVGGLERVVQALAIGQHRAGHRVLVIAVVEPSDSTHPFVVPLREAGVAVETIALPGRAYLRERSAVRAILQRVRPDVVHTHGYRSDLLDGTVARALGIPIVSTVHGSSRLGGKSHFFEWLQGIAWRRFDVVVAVSRDLERRMLESGVPRDRLALIPNAWPGVEPGLSRDAARTRLGLRADERVIAFVGRLIPAKGPDIFARALALSHDETWTAVIVGEGLLREEVERIIAEAGLTDRVRFTGHLDDATHLFPAFDLFVLSSRTEGTPIVLFEAMAASVPIVATRVGGVPEVVSDAEAILVPSEDIPALADAIRTAAGAEAHTRAQRARARLLLDFGTAQWIDQHVRAYRAASARGTGSTGSTG